MRTLLAALAMLGAAACDPAEAVSAEKSGALQVANASELQLTGRVVDAAELIDPEREAVLTSKLAALESATSDQLVIVTVPTLNEKTIERFTLDLGRGWGIGRADIDNGVIILLAPTERKVRIEVGYGLEGLLTDARAGEIIKATILPRFKAGDFSGGLSAGADDIDRLLRSDRRRPQPKPVDVKEAA